MIQGNPNQSLEPTSLGKPWSNVMILKPQTFEVKTRTSDPGTGNFQLGTWTVETKASFSKQKALAFEIKTWVLEKKG